MSTRQSTDDQHDSSMKIGPDDVRYRAVIDKQFNKRYRANPDYVRIVSSTEEIKSAVQDAVRENRRFVITSGGHCLEGFVSDPEVRVIIDVSPMKRVYYDAEMRAIAVEAGATVGETLRALHDSWGVVLPLGQYPGIGMGGHVAGGCFGFLHRQLGLAADYLYAVEVVTVGREGRANTVVATRDASDPHRELWWAHTGGGAGNFGVATRFWFRANDASGEDPADGAASRAEVRVRLQGGVELERSQRIIFSSAAAKPRGVVREEQRCEVAEHHRSSRCWKFIVRSSARSLRAV